MITQYEDNIQTLAAKSTRKVNKAKILENIQSMYKRCSDAQDQEYLADMYSYFSPSVPAKPKTSWEWVRKAMPKKDVRYYLHYIHCENGAIVTTDGHRMHIDYAGGEWLPSDGSYDVNKNLVPAEVAGKFPDWKRVVPTSTGRVAIPVHSLELSYGIAGKIEYITLSVNGNVIIHVQKKYWLDAMSYLDDTELWYSPTTSEMDNVLLKSGDLAVVLMGMRV